MLTIILTKIRRFILLFLPLAGFVPLCSYSQDTLKSTVADSVVKVPKKPILNSRVDYQATDSLRFSVKEKKVYLFHEADIKYQDIGVKADYIEIDFDKNTLYARGVPDSTGKDTGLPEFSQGDQVYKSKILTYNFDSKKGYIQKVLTKQDEGYLHGEIVKKMPDDITYIRSGSYTTCSEEEHVHFEFKFGKAKVIPKKSIITGPAYMSIAGVPTPLIIPFGYFPNRSGKRSGIVIPTYGESNDRGFFLENGGYYWAINDYMDLKVLGDIYSHGSWAIKPTFNYTKRYHYGGSLNLGYAYNRIGVEDTPGFQESRDYRIYWVHSQDRKARPRSSFSGNVNIVSSNFNKYNPSNTENYLSNTFASSINYATSFGGVANLNLNFSHSQNTIDKTISITLPQLTFTVNQFYPFRSKERVGKSRWYDKIGLRYNFDAQNRYNTYDTILFAPGWTKELQNGIKHSLPIGGTWQILKFINFSNAVNLNDRMYFSTQHRRYIDSVFTDTDTIPGYYKTDTVYNFANAFDFSLTSSLSTRLYGMYQLKKGPVLAFRHMMTPSVSFSYTPDFSKEFWGYYEYIENDPAAEPKKYSIFQGQMYGGPPPADAGVVAFNLSNNLEMKVRNRKDTVLGTKKVMLIDNFGISSSYDIAKDSMNWSMLTLSGRTTLFRVINIQYVSRWDPYARNEKGTRINTSEWQKNRRLLRLETTSWDLGLNYSFSSEKVKGKKKPATGSTEEIRDIIDYYDNYVDFDIPWSFSFSYNFRFSKEYSTGEMRRLGKIVQTFNFNGQLNITPKWKITLTSGWDFTNNQLSYTSIDVYRDLHCWEMRFGWIPKGARQSWNFSINVKASILQDMKLNKKKDFRDSYY